MLYSLRKLIAFVFLLGIFWFVYRDLGNLGEPSFMTSLGVLVLLFGIFWLLVPILVVNLRVRHRVKQNRARYAAWREQTGGALRPLPPRECRLALAEGEGVFLHEKGTLYVESGAGFDDVSVAGKLGNVAFPGDSRTWRKVQRTHFYLTDRRIVFAGKALELAFPLDPLDARPAPGGIVFGVTHDGAPLRLAFTFANPLVAADLLGQVRELPKK